MNRSARRLLPLVLFTSALVVGASWVRAAATVADLPARLTDSEFWKLSDALSEPNGQFRSENLLSNEMVLWKLIPDVEAKVKPGSGVYMGVGPEQNFSYMAVIKPRMAFITDIRRGNLHALLMYRALFDLSADRADFIGKLFTKARPAGLTEASSVAQIMDAYWDVPTGDEAAYTKNLDAILTNLTKTHPLPLDAEDRDGISKTYRSFYYYGLRMNYSANTTLTATGGGGATYYDLMTQKDANGRALSYLASTASFGVVKDMFAKNLVVPVVGNFSGPKAIRAIGEYVRTHGSTVTAFYVSSVENYLRRDGSQPTFCANVATLPMNEASVFIRPQSGPPPAINQSAGSYQNGMVVPLATGCSPAPATSSLR